MQLSDIQSMRGYAEQLGEDARLTPLYPQGGGNGLLALDLLEVEAGGQAPLRAAGEEQVLFVTSGNGELVQDGTSVGVHGGSIVALGPLESYSLRNTDQTRLRVVVAVSLVARTARGLGLKSGTLPAAPSQPQSQPSSLPQHPRVTLLDERTNSTEHGGEAGVPVEEAGAERQLDQARAVLREAPAEVVPAAHTAPPVVEQPEAVQQEPEAPQAEPSPDISGLMKRGSEVAAKPRSEHRKPPPSPELPAEVAEEAAPEAGEAEAAETGNMMELQIVFDGGSRGNPGQGYGSFIVQTPGGRPSRPRKLEFGDNYTNNQAEYDTLIGSLEYIIDRLTKTGRSPDQAQLDIKTDSDLVVNQILGNFKMKDAGLRKRHEQATNLLSQFADWTISWHPRDESVRLLGH